MICMKDMPDIICVRYIYDVYTIYMICIRTVMSDIWYMMYMIWSC